MLKIGNSGSNIINQLNYGVMRLLNQKLDYIHNNPVGAGFVTEPQHRKYSSAASFCGEVGIIKLDGL